MVEKLYNKASCWVYEHPTASTILMVIITIATAAIEGM